MSRFGRRTDKTGELSELHRAVVELRERLAEEQQATAGLQYRLHDMERRNFEIAAELQHTRTAPPAPANETPNPEPKARQPLPPPRPMDEVDARTAWLVESLELTVAHLSQRLDELSLHFERRLGELGYEIERAAASSRATGAVGDLALGRQLESVREAQVRLANEQARFEISLRDELAGVADLLNQSSR